MTHGRQVQLWWAPGHQGIAGNERAAAAVRAAIEKSQTTTGEFVVKTAMLEGELCHWYQV